MRRAHVWLEAALAVGLLIHPAAGQVRGTIFGPGGKQYPVAVSSLKEEGPAGPRPDLADQFHRILVRDLELSGLFRVIPPDTYIENPQTSGITADEINFDNWSVVGALALVKGSLRVEGGDLTIEARLFDVAQRRMLTGRRYRGSPGDVRRMAQRFADEILARLTGEPGPFDSQIAFLSTRGGRFKDLYVMSVDGGDVRRITSADTLNLSPSWAPDDRSIVLTSYRTGNPDLFSIRLADQTWTRLSALPGLNLGGHWSPDGSRIAVTLEYQGNSEIALLSPDGSLRRRLTNHRAIDVSPSWSPDGRQIAFCSSRAGSPQIYVMNADGGGSHRITSVGDYNTSPSWSPKGDRLAYTSRVAGRFQIFTVGTDGTDVHQVTSSRGDNEDPSWSPDGRYLVFSSTRGGSARLYLADAAGTNQVELTAGSGSDTSPAWSGRLD
jgi:TolB protein